MSRRWLAYWLVMVVSASMVVDHAWAKDDWLLDASSFKAEFTAAATADVPDQFSLSNGIASRAFLLNSPVAATIGLTCDGQERIRAIQPEAMVTIDGVEYVVGGLQGQPNHAFLREQWLAKMQPAENALQFVGFRVGDTVARFPWKRVRHHAPDVNWPPPGIQLTLEFHPPLANGSSDSANFKVYVHYELYDGIPLFCKWITIENTSANCIQVDRFSSERLALVETESRVETREGVPIPPPDYLHVETDFAFGGFVHENANRHTVHWRPDPDYATQVNYERQTPCLLVVEPTYGPAQTIDPQSTFTSMRTFELLHDGTDRQRKSLALRKMYRTIAPWVTENPLMHHMRTAEPDAVRRAIDDAAEVGFEMVILSFGSGFNIEDDSKANLERWRDIAQHATNKNVELGGYSLLSSRRIGGGNDIVPPPGVKLTHGNCPSLTSEWGVAYYQKLYHFFESTGFTLLEHDGPYPGDIDVTARPPLQKGLQDSRWAQAAIANRFYRWCREQGIYVNAPDFYYLNGTNKCGMGYREVNWSLPRAMQLIHTRQNIYDGTWHKTPSMGWMFVPLSEYHGGGQAATIEPLDTHREHYERMIQSNLAAGVQACFRGPRLFDTDRTKQMVKQNVEWFKKHRNILESDVIHGRRPDGRNLDWILHANPKLPTKGMLIVHNPNEESATETLSVNVYYTGLAKTAIVQGSQEAAKAYPIDRDYQIEIPVNVPAHSMNWYTIQ